MIIAQSIDTQALNFFCFRTVSRPAPGLFFRKVDSPILCRTKSGIPLERSWSISGLFPHDQIHLPWKRPRYGTGFVQWTCAVSRFKAPRASAAARCIMSQSLLHLRTLVQETLFCLARHHSAIAPDLAKYRQDCPGVSEPRPEPKIRSSLHNTKKANHPAYSCLASLPSAGDCNHFGHHLGQLLVLISFQPAAQPSHAQPNDM